MRKCLGVLLLVVALVGCIAITAEANPPRRWHRDRRDHHREWRHRRPGVSVHIGRRPSWGLNHHRRWYAQPPVVYNVPPPVVYYAPPPVVYYQPVPPPPVMYYPPVPAAPPGYYPVPYYR